MDPILRRASESFMRRSSILMPIPRHVLEAFVEKYLTAAADGGCPERGSLTASNRMVDDV